MTIFRRIETDFCCFLLRTPRMDVVKILKGWAFDFLRGLDIPVKITQKNDYG